MTEFVTSVNYLALKSYTIWCLIFAGLKFRKFWAIRRFHTLRDKSGIAALFQACGWTAFRVQASRSTRSAVKICALVSNICCEHWSCLTPTIYCWRYCQADLSEGECEGESQDREASSGTWSVSHYSLLCYKAYWPAYRVKLCAYMEESLHCTASKTEEQKKENNTVDLLAANGGQIYWVWWIH